MDNFDTGVADPARDADAAWALVEALSTQPREKPQDANDGVDLIVRHLESAGLPVTVYEFELYLSAPIHAEVRAGGETFRAKPPAFCASRPDGVTAPLIYLPEAGGGTPLDRNPNNASALPDVAGKICLIEGFALPNFTAGLEAAGAVGVIAINPGDRIHWGTVSTIWGTPEPEDLARLPKIPSAAVNRASGDALIAMAREGGSATVVTELETGWAPQKLPVVEIPGTESPEKFVLIHGHHDAWDVGVGDNGTGNACMLGVARRLWGMRGSLKRSVRLAWWPGHSLGRYGGSAWFADHFALDLNRNCVVHMNCDSPGCRDAVDYSSISLTAETESAVKQIVRTVTGQETKGKRPQRNSDYTFSNIGISGCFSASSMITEETRQKHGWYVVGGCGGNIAWHTEFDQMEVADREVLGRDIELYTEAARHFASADVLPIDWRATAAEFAATVARYDAAAGEAFDLGPAAEAVASFAKVCEAFHAAVDSGAIPAAAANEAMTAVARILVPINFVRGQRFTHDPALNTPQLPVIEPALRLSQYGPDTLGFAKAQLVRGQNRLIAALEEAAERLARAGAA